MSTSARRQREIAEREDLFLTLARSLFVERGYHGLNMDHIAERSEYSKGTVYGHFASKEDLIAALCTETIRLRGEYFRRAIAFDGRPRERLAGVGIADMIFVRKQPDHVASEHVLNVGSVFDRISEKRREAFIEAKSGLMRPIQAVLEEAVAKGDLMLPDHVPSCYVMYGLWTQSVGHHIIASVASVPPFVGQNLSDALWENYNRFLDGFLFRPLSHEKDYRRTRERILEEVFPEERDVLDDVWTPVSSEFPRDLSL